MSPFSTIFQRIICIIAFLALHIYAHSQALHWVKTIGSPNADEGKAIATGSSGDVYSAGNFQDTAYFSWGGGISILSSNGGNDIFINKLNTTGNLAWAKQIGGPGDEQCNAIAVDGNGNVYITGIFLGTTDFDPGPGIYNITSSSSTDAFICKLDASGNFIWAIKFGEGPSQLIFPYPVISNAIALDDSGNVYTTGSFDGKTDFDPGPGIFYLTPGLMGGSYTTDIFISKVDASGNFVWAKQLGGTGFEAGYAIAVDDGGNIYTTGFFNGTVDFDPGAASFNLSALPNETVIYISKLDASGKFAWAKQMGGRTGYAIAIDNAGNLYVTGDYMNDSITINKLSPAGNIIWSKQIGASIGWSLAVDKSCNLYITGQFYGQADFDPGAGTFYLTSAGTADCYISKLDSAGNLAWARQLGGTFNVTGRSVAVDKNSNVYTTGTFEGTTDFDPAATTLNLASLGSMDIFIHKIKQEIVGISSDPNCRFKIYPNPTNGKFIVEFDKVYDHSTIILRNMIGQLVYKTSVNNSDRVALDIIAAKGVYILELYHQNGQNICSATSEILNIRDR